jgi:hypothetical protein
VLVKKSRLGRPRGRKAPHRPVLSTVLSGRVDPELLRQVKASAKAAGRTVSEEVLFRALQSFEPRLDGQLLERGYTRIPTAQGVAWLEPGMLAPTWIITSDDVLRDLIKRGEVRLVEKTKAQP